MRKKRIRGEEVAMSKLSKEMLCNPTVLCPEKEGAKHGWSQGAGLWVECSLRIRKFTHMGKMHWGKKNYKGSMLD